MTLKQDGLGVRRASGAVENNLHATSAISLSGALIGAAATAPAVGDTVVESILIRKNAGPCTVTLTGFQFDEDGTTARTLVLTGSATDDRLYEWDELTNVAAAAQITASVADCVSVWHRAP